MVIETIVFRSPIQEKYFWELRKFLNENGCVKLAVLSMPITIKLIHVIFVIRCVFVFKYYFKL